MREYQLYEILLFFALYSILGWAADRCVFALRKRPGGRGLCKGPYMPGFGIGALLIVAGTGPAARELASWLGTDRDMTLPAAAVCALGAGLACALVCGILTRLCSGKRLVHITVSDPLLWMAGGVITAVHLQPLLTAVIRWMNPWIHMVFLSVVLLEMTGDCVDGTAALFRLRKKGTISKEAE